MSAPLLDIRDLSIAADAPAQEKADPSQPDDLRSMAGFVAAFAGVHLAIEVVVPHHAAAVQAAARQHHRPVARLDVPAARDECAGGDVRKGCKDVRNAHQAQVAAQLHGLALGCVRLVFRARVRR